MVLQYNQQSQIKGNCTETRFRISSSFCQLGNSLFSQLAARQIIGSAKNPNPTKKVFIFMNIAEFVRSDIANTGTRIPANLRRGPSSGKGGVGDSALMESKPNSHDLRTIQHT